MLLGISLRAYAMLKALPAYHVGLPHASPVALLWGSGLSALASWQNPCALTLLCLQVI